MKRKLLSHNFLRKFMFFLMLLVFPSAIHIIAQQINPKILEFDKICAGGPHPTKPGEFFNEYQASFSISGFATDVTFKVELSDPTGSFTVPTSTTTLGPLPITPPDTATDKTLVFAVPTNLIGSNSYKLRVVSSTGIASQPFTVQGTTSTKNFPAYYKAFSGPFAINNNQPTVSFCFGGSVTLTVYNPTPSLPNSSPANYPQLKYIWFKDEVVISGQTSSSLVVNTTGVFYAKLDYGQCTDDNFRSQGVTVSGATGVGSVLVSSSGNPFCSSLGNTTLSVTNGNSYVWKKDNAVITGATSSTYATNLPGIYTCDVDYGGCKSTGTIDLNVFEINSSISGVDVDVVDGDIDGDGDKDVDVDGDGDIGDKDDKVGVNYISEGETVFVTATTSAVSPSYQWFLNGTLIFGETNSSLGITDEGKYKLIITQTSGCNIVNVFLFEVSFRVKLEAPKITNIVALDKDSDNDGVNDFWIIPDIYTVDDPKHFTDGKTHIMILNSYGEIVFETDDYDNFNGWPEKDKSIDFNNFNPVYYYIITPNGSSAKKGSITLVK